MSSLPTISLFSDRPEVTQRPTSFLVSIAAHAGAIALLSVGIIYSPKINDSAVTRKYALRHIDMHTEKEESHHSPSQGVSYPRSTSAPKPGPEAKVHHPAPGDKPGVERAVLRQTVAADKGPQTLIQPDIMEPLQLKIETPVPTVVIWTPKVELAKKVVAPLPEPATAADVKPSIKPPNDEINLGDLGISSSLTPTDRLPVFPSTTAPMVVHGPKLVQMAPVTATQTKQAPTPTAVMSISDLRMADGTATLPPVNQSALQNDTGMLAPGVASSGNVGNHPGGVGIDARTGDGGAVATVTGARSGNQPASGDGAGNDAFTSEHFTLPKNGEFGAVIVGASLQEKYPEMSAVWNNRVAYTVYLHVGLQKSWILQYSLPRNGDAAAAGNITRLEAPWPYNIVRPNIASGAFNADAILVHGFVNQSGHFEQLGLAFPPEFREAQFVLDALNQWQFRPAVQNGQTERVEVLLIIPEEDQ